MPCSCTAMHTSTDSPSDHPPLPLAREGPEAWAAQRRQWRRKRRHNSDGSGSSDGTLLRRSVIPPDASYEDILLPIGRPFDQPIPLSVSLS